MAVVYAVKSGNWSDTTTWNTGSLPQPGDTVCANNYTVTIDQDVDLWVSGTPAGIITTRAYSPAVAGGGFTCSRNNTTIRCEKIEAYTTALTISANGCAVYANVHGSNHTSSNYVYGIDYTGSGTLAIYGDVYGGSAANYHPGVNNASTGTVNITGNVTGGIGSYAYGVNNAGTGTVQITGNVTGGTIGATHGVNNASTGTVNITGNVTGGSNSGAYGVNNVSNGTVNVTGNAHYGKTGFAIYSTSNGILRVAGDLYADPAPAVYWTGTGAYCAIDGNEYGNISGSNQGIRAVFAYRRGTKQANSRLIRVAAVQDDLSTYIADTGAFYYGALYPNLFNYPGENHVRSGVTYGPNLEFQGSCAVPAPQSVLYGVPVDNTTGTAAVTQEAIASAVFNQIIDGNLTFKQIEALIAAVLLGRISGAGTGNITIRAVNDANTTRVSATVDNYGNRTNVTLTPPT